MREEGRGGRGGGEFRRSKNVQERGASLFAGCVIGAFDFLQYLSKLRNKS